jgi:hypothetical protein
VVEQSGNESGEKNTGIRRLINSGLEIAGGAVGGALGFLAGGPLGAAALGAGGTAAAMVLKHIGQEASQRLLGPREEIRVGGVLAIAAGEIRQRIEAGEKVRTDGFFEKKRAGRSDAEEVAESVLLKSQREPEEKKIPYMGHLLSSVAFDPTISTHMAHQVTKAAEQLTYRQLCLLKLSVVKDSFGLRSEDYRKQGQFQKELYQLLYECIDLYHRGFLNFGGGVAFGPTDIVPGKMTVQGLGADIINLMKLGLIPNEDLLPIVGQLK